MNMIGGIVMPLRYLVIQTSRMSNLAYSRYRRDWRILGKHDDIGQRDCENSSESDQSEWILVRDQSGLSSQTVAAVDRLTT